MKWYLRGFLGPALTEKGNNSRRLFWVNFCKCLDWWRQIWESHIRRLFAVIPARSHNALSTLHTLHASNMSDASDKESSSSVVFFSWRFQWWMVMFIAFFWRPDFGRQWKHDGPAVPVWTRAGWRGRGPRNLHRQWPGQNTEHPNSGLRFRYFPALCSVNQSIFNRNVSWT